MIPFRTARQREVNTNLVAISAAVSACEKGSQWQKALGLLVEFLRAGSGPHHKINHILNQIKLGTGYDN